MGVLEVASYTKCAAGGDFHDLAPQRNSGRNVSLFMADVRTEKKGIIGPIAWTSATRQRS